MSRPTSKITGNSSPFQQPSQYSRDEAGSKSSITFEMTSRVHFNALVSMLNQQGVPYDAQEGFGKHSVTAHYPFDYNLDPSTEPPVILWEMISNKLEKSIVDADNANTRALIQQDIATLNSLVDDIQAYIFSIQNPPPTPNPSNFQFGDLDPTKISFSTNAPSAAAALKLANLIISGVQSQPVFFPTLRQTATVNAAYPISATFFNVGDIISTQSMYTIYNVPNVTLLTLPNYDDPQLDASRPVLHYGWFMDAPEVRQIAFLKWQIIFNWSYGLWPESVFGTPL